MGERDVTLECVIERKNANIYNSSPISEKILTDLKSAAIQQFAIDFPNAPVKESFYYKSNLQF